MYWKIRFIMLCTENKRIMHLNTSFWNEAHTNYMYDDDVEYSPPVKFPKILFSGFRKELKPNLSQPISLNIFYFICIEKGLGISYTTLLMPSQPIRGHVGHLGFSNEPEKHKLGRWLWDLASCQVSVVSEKSKVSQPIKGQGGQLGFLIGPKYTNLVEDIDVLVPFMFRCIPFSDCRDKNEKYLSQLEARAAILDFGSARKTQTG